MDSIKIFTIFAGANGADKSTLFHIEKGIHLGVTLKRTVCAVLFFI